jgi:hypothetical protein
MELILSNMDKSGSVKYSYWRHAGTGVVIASICVKSPFLCRQGSHLRQFLSVRLVADDGKSPVFSEMQSQSFVSKKNSAHNFMN